MNRILNLGNPLPLLRAFKYSLRGLAYAARHERAFMQELILLVIAVVAALLLTDSSIERAVLIGSAAFVLVVELINSAIETTIDRIGPEQHPLSERAKDLGSATVLVALSITAVIWLIVLL